MADIPIVGIGYDMDNVMRGVLCEDIQEVRE